MCWCCGASFGDLAWETWHRFTLCGTDLRSFAYPVLNARGMFSGKHTHWERLRPGVLGDWLLSSSSCLRETCLALPACEHHQATGEPTGSFFLPRDIILSTPTSTCVLIKSVLGNPPPGPAVCHLSPTGHRAPAELLGAGGPSVDLEACGEQGGRQGPEHTDACPPRVGQQKASNAFSLLISISSFFHNKQVSIASVKRRKFSI